MVRPRGVEEVEVAWVCCRRRGWESGLVRCSVKSPGPAGGISLMTRPGDPCVVPRSASGRLHRCRVDWEVLLTPSSTELLPPLSSSLGVLLLKPGNTLTAICGREKKYIREARSRETWIYYREKERGEPGERFEQGHRESERFIVLWRT